MEVGIYLAGDAVDRAGDSVGCDGSRRDGVDGVVAAIRSGLHRLDRRLLAHELLHEGSILGLGAQAGGFGKIAATHRDTCDFALGIQPGNHLNGPAISLGHRRAHIALRRAIGAAYVQLGQRGDIRHLHRLKCFRHRQYILARLHLGILSLLVDDVLGHFIRHGKKEPGAYRDNAQCNPGCDPLFHALCPPSIV